MTEKIKALYKRAINDTEFLAAIKSADGDEKPGLFASDLKKILFATIYYGWLVGTYGDDWNKVRTKEKPGHIKAKIFIVIDAESPVKECVYSLHDNREDAEKSAKELDEMVHGGCVTYIVEEVVSMPATKLAINYK